MSEENRKKFFNLFSLNTCNKNGIFIQKAWFFLKNLVWASFHRENSFHLWDMATSNILRLIWSIFEYTQFFPWQFWVTAIRTQFKTRGGGRVIWCVLPIIPSMRYQNRNFTRWRISAFSFPNITSGKRMVQNLRRVEF